MLNDLRYAIRMLLKNPGFTVAAVLTLALGIGANTAIFSVVDAVLLRALPFDQPHQLVQLWQDDSGGKGLGRNTISAPAFADWQSQNTTLENIAAYTSVALNITGQGQPERLRGLRVSASYQEVFRIKPILGRGFLPEEDQPGKDKVVLLTHGLWQRRFGGETNLVGRSVRLGGENRTVVGVLSPQPLLLAGREFLVPLVLASEVSAHNRGDHWLRVVARLKPGVTSEQARTEINTIIQRQNQTLPASEADSGVTVVRLEDQITGDIRPKLLLLMGAVAFVLLIACVNIGNLVLARAVERQREIAIRAALGAGRWRVIRQLLTESVLLSLLGGGLGVLLGFCGADLLKHLAVADVPRAEEIGPDYRMLAFALSISVVTGVVFGLAPALQTARLNLTGTLKESARGGSRSAAGGRTHGALIAIETALALMLLVGSGLMLRSLLKLERVSPGFKPKNVLLLSLSLDEAKYPDAERRALFCSHIIERIEALPGVEAAGIAGGVFNWNNTSIRVEGRANQPEGGYSTDYDYTFGSYFRALGVPVLKGRAFTQHDHSANAPRVAILSDALARRLFADHDPVGQRVQAFGQTWNVLGVVGDVRHHGLDSAACERLYLPSQGGDGSLIVHTKAAPLALIGAIRKEIFSVDPDQPVSNVRTLEEEVSSSFADRRLVLVLLGLFAAAALLLAAIGLYGVIAYSVSQRIREIGIRTALGAQRFDVFKLVLNQGMKLVSIGVSIGVVGALILTRIMRTLLYGVEPTDPLTFAAVSILFLTVAMFACWLPARRATKVDPMEALRHE